MIRGGGLSLILLLLIGLASCGDDAPSGSTPEAPTAPRPAKDVTEQPAAPVDPVTALLAESKAKSYIQAIEGTEASFEMIWVPGEEFWVGKTEVTWDEYEVYALGEETPEGVDAVSRPSRSYHPYDRGWGVGKRPACGMTRQAALAYCTWLSKRTGRTYTLPTSDEWQRVFDRWQLPATTPLGTRAWYVGNSSGKTWPVGQKRANRLGLHDMLGNVLEYTLDTAPEDENGDEWPILRGGSFASPKAKVNGNSPQPQLFIWHEREPQRPRSQWWLCDGPFTGFRVMRHASRASGGSSK